MRKILSAEHDQLLLLAPSVEEWVKADHPARFVREFVAALPLAELKLDTLEREEGGVAYDPRLLVGAWLYGYLCKVRSTRAVERACREEMGFVWLTGNHQPDHNALWRFWTAHRAQLHELFRQTIRVAVDLKLVGLVVQAVDGTKIAAAASGRGGFDRAHLEKLLARLDAELQEREAAIAQAGDEASVALPPELQPTARLRERVQAALARVQAGETKHAHPLEPEAARMQCDGRNRFGYNAQAVVDQQAQIVLAAEVTNAPTDAAQLVPMVAAAQANCEPTSATPLTLADGGYASAAQFTAASNAGYPVLTPPPSSWRDTSDPYHAAHFRHLPERQVVVCPQGRELPFRHLRKKRALAVEVYRSAKACKDCPVRAQCTSDRHGRTIEIQPGHAEVVRAHARWQQPATAELYAFRAATVEPVFAQIKQQMGFRRWTVRGLPKVAAQWAMLCTTWNLKVLYRHWRKGKSDSNPDDPTPPGPGRRPPRPARSRPRNFLSAHGGFPAPAFAA